MRSCPFISFPVGMSKAAIVLFESATQKRAVFFALLNPQPNSACFAGVEIAYNPPLDFSSFSNIDLELRGQGMFDTFKIVLQDSQSYLNSSLAFEQSFKVDMTSEFSQITMPLDLFVCSYRGQKCSSTLQIRSIVSFGIQAAGGIYDDTIRQKGTASLEINYIVLN